MASVEGRDGGGNGERRSVRVRLREDAEANYELVRNVLQEAVGAEIVRWGDCPRCGKRVPVSFPDVRARTEAVRLWLDQGYGRPKETLEIVDASAEKATRHIADMARAFSYAEIPRAQLHAALVYASTAVGKRHELPPWRELDGGAYGLPTEASPAAMSRHQKKIAPPA
jgi:hypothetical protein